MGDTPNRAVFVLNIVAVPLGHTRLALRVPALVLTCQACLSIPCDQWVVRQMESPTHKYKAAIVASDCGATTRTGYSLRILLAEEDLDARVSPLSVQSPYPTKVPEFTSADYAETERIDIRWIAPDTLEATVDSRAEVRRTDRGGPEGVGLTIRTRYKE